MGQHIIKLSKLYSTQNILSFCCLYLVALSFGASNAEVGQLFEVVTDTIVRQMLLDFFHR